MEKIFHQLIEGVIMSQRKIYVALPYFSHEKSIEALSSVGDLTIRKDNRPSEDELVELSDNYEVLIIGVLEKMTPMVYEHSKKLQIIGTLSIGLDHICEEFKQDNRFKIVYCKTSNVISVAEYTLMLILSLIKDLINARTGSLNNIDRAKLERPKDLDEKTIGIIGAGKIATEVHRLLQHFNVKTLAWTRYPEKHSDLNRYGAQFVALEELLRNSDIITLHIPLSNETQGFLSSKELSLLKSNAIVINTARAKLIDNETLFRMIQHGKIFGAAIDDFNYDIEVSIPEHPRIITTPHMAGISTEAILRMQYEVALGVKEIFS